MKQFTKYLIVAILCSPVFFINIKTSHDWGDDFAQYIHQAHNIVHGIPQSETGYIYNPNYPLLGPPSYPAGFPILLAPVVALFGNDILHLDLYISFFLFALALLTFHFLLRYYSALISALLVIILIYNPWTLNFKMEIMSDIPFTFFLLLCVYLYLHKNSYTLLTSISLALLSGFLISIRNIGIVFIAATVIHMLRELYYYRAAIKSRSFDYRKLKSRAIIVAGGLTTHLLINKVLFPSAGDRIFSYEYIFNGVQLLDFVKANLHYYMAVLRYFFEPGNEDWQFVALFSSSMIFAFIFLGFVKKVTEKIGFLEVLVSIYLLIIIVYPYSNAGVRFLLPLIPFLLYYAVEGLKAIRIKVGMNRSVLAILLGVFVLCSYQSGLSEIFKREKDTLAGPQQAESLELFTYIQQHTEVNSRFNFAKPRALSLYAGRNAMSVKRMQSMRTISNDLTSNNINYILSNSELRDDSLLAFIRTHESELERTWSNSKFTLYRRR